MKNLQFQVLNVQSKDEINDFPKSDKYEIGPTEQLWVTGIKVNPPVNLLTQISKDLGTIVGHYHGDDNLKSRTIISRVEQSVMILVLYSHRKVD